MRNSVPSGFTLLVGFVIVILTFVGCIFIDLLYFPTVGLPVILSLAGVMASFVGGALMALAVWNPLDGGHISITMIRIGAIGVVMVCPSNQLYAFEAWRTIASPPILHLVELINLVGFVAAVAGIVWFVLLTASNTRRARWQLITIAMGVLSVSVGIAVSGHVGHGIISAAMDTEWLGCAGILIGIVLLLWLCGILIYLDTSRIPSQFLLCHKCGYDLRGIASDRCPECGGFRSMSAVATRD